MARINVEDALFKDNRFANLIGKLGSRRAALGAVVEAWITAQPFWVNTKHGIPVPVWERQGLANEIIEVGLARRDNEFIYMHGSSEQFNWLEGRSAAGKLGGEAKARNNREKTLANSSKLKQTVASYSSSSSFSKKEEERRTKGELVARAQEPASLTLENQKPDPKALARKEQAARASTFVGAYVKAYQSRFPKGRPEDVNDPKVRGQIVALVKDYPVDRLCELIQVYFQLDVKWFATKGYDFMTFRSNLNSIGQALDSGSDPNSIDWTKVFA